MHNLDILVVDDEPHIARALNFVFRKEGFAVETAADGDEALARIREHRPRIVFLDLILPRRSGTDVCKTVKNDPILRNTHIIILTCKGQELDRDQSMAAGANEFITKPFSPKEVVARVRTLLATGQQDSA